MSQKFYIPDLLEDWKWANRLINPYYQEVRAESEAWMRNFGAFEPKAQHAFDRCDFSLLAALGHPTFDRARLRTACDLITALAMFDEHTDAADGAEAQRMGEIFKDAVRNPHTPRPKGEWIGGEVARSYWELGIETASPQCQKHFVEILDKYIDAVVEQAVDRNRKHTRNVEDFLKLRTWASAVPPCLALIELDINLPDEVIHHPVIEELTTLATQMIMLGNDVASYNLEQARDDDTHNTVKIIMQNHKTDIQGGMDWVAEYHKGIVARFMDLYENKLPKFGEPVDAEVAQYLDGLGLWVRGNDYWQFESARYFGTKGVGIQQTRWTMLMPKGLREAVGPRLVDESGW
ncbi:terpenoid synthase [Gloeopeniophorella convolvens]|nr:terpenoid synthase [Gloeopeniophorella convolvens]